MNSVREVVSLLSLELVYELGGLPGKASLLCGHQGL